MSDKPKARGSLYIICYDIQVCQIKKVHIFATYLEEKKRYISIHFKIIW